MEGDVRWHHGQTLASGQVAEFKVWGELVRQSMGGLHVFLPLRDEGIDGVLHRLSDGLYVAVQVKGRMSLTPAGQAAHDMVDGREYLTAAFALHAGGGSRWAPFLVPREKLAERFGIVAPPAPSAPPPHEWGGPTVVDRRQEGFLGEAEVVRRLAEVGSLALFRPFPDLETVEVLALQLESRGWAGLQVKTAGWDRAHVETRVYLRRSSFRAAPSTFICVLGWGG